MQRDQKHYYWENRHRKQNDKPPIIFTSMSICDICHKPRPGHDHRVCSKIRQKKRRQEEQKRQQAILPEKKD